MVLSEIAKYVDESIRSTDITLEEYITIDCLLQNKEGRTIATNLPPSPCSLTKYKPGDILIGNIRPYLKKIWKANCKGGCSNDVLVFRAKDSNLSDYLYALLLQDNFYSYVMKAPKGSKMPRGDKNHIMRFPVADIGSNSINVGGFISDIERKMTNNRKQNDILEKLAKQLYDYWFVQFDFPDENGRPYKSSGGVMVYNPILKRYIPKRWKTDKLINILDILKDGTHNPPKRIEFGIPLLTGTMFGKNFLEYEKATYISEDDYKQIHKKYSPKQFDVIITKIGTLGNVNVLTRRDIPIAIHCNSALLRFPDNWGNYFPFLMCKSPVFYSRLKAVKGKSIQEFASLDKIGSIYVEVPDNKTMCVFNKKIEPIIQKLMFLREEIIELEKTKNEILPLLMTGQVKLK